MTFEIMIYFKRNVNLFSVDIHEYFIKIIFKNLNQGKVTF